MGGQRHYAPLDSRIKQYLAHLHHFGTTMRDFFRLIRLLTSLPRGFKLLKQGPVDSSPYWPAAINPFSGIFEQRLIVVFLLYVRDAMWSELLF